MFAFGWSIRTRMAAEKKGGFAAGVAAKSAHFHHSLWLA
jgi:hypothetical protein